MEKGGAGRSTRDAPHALTHPDPVLLPCLMVCEVRPVLCGGQW